MGSPLTDDTKEMPPGGSIAVLGGTGLIGRHVLLALARVGRGNLVATYRRRPPFECPGLDWRQADLLDSRAARMALRGVRRAVICAGRVSTAAELRRDPVSSVLETLRIGVNALEAASAEGVEQVVLIGSCTGYPSGVDANIEAGMFAGDPPAAWFGVGWMHRYLEKQLEWHARHLGRIRFAVVLRPTLVYGPHDDFSFESGHFVPSMVRRVVEREKPIEVWGDGTQSRNLIHAGDVAAAVLAALARPETWATYNIASTGGASVKEVLSTLIELDGFDDAEIVYRKDMPVGAAALDVSSAAFASRHAWLPSMSLRVGLAQTLEWYRATRGQER